MPLSSSPMSSLTPIPRSQKSDTDPFRQTQEIPNELIQHLHAYYEEDLNAQGFDFLHSVTANSVSLYDPQAKVSIPPPPHIALAATIAVHPNTTTRTEDRGKLAQSISALKLLRLLVNVSGPYLPYQKILRFRKFQGNFFHLTPKSKRDAYTHIETRHQYTEANSLFNRADDFWSLVGWAFNCACLPDMHAERWKVYEPFLTLMLQILETDYVHCHEKQAWEESLLWSYVELASGGHGSTRRMFRAIFASGSARDLNEFREVFNKELKPPAKKEDSVKREIDLENDEFADYAGVSSEELSETEDTRPNKRIRVRSRARTPSAKASNESLNSTFEADASKASSLGTPECIRLRTRLLRLLAAISTQPSLIAHSSTAFVAEDELYTLFVEFIKPLPLPIFQQIILPDTHASDPFDSQTHIRMCEAILQRTLESKAPRNDGQLTAARLIQCYLQFAASSPDADAQARVAILLEALTRIAMKEGVLRDGSVDNQVVQWAVEEGTRRREKIAFEASKKKGKKNNDDESRAVLRASSDRLRMLLLHHWR